MYRIAITPWLELVAKQSISSPEINWQFALQLLEELFQNAKLTKNQKGMLLTISFLAYKKACEEIKNE